MLLTKLLEGSNKSFFQRTREQEARPTSTDSSGGSELNALSNKARIFWSSFIRIKKSAYLIYSENSQYTFWYEWNYR